ncbi:alpha/beta fold hydrolase [Chryseobacterium cheonjiense]|uniref:Alpha/beta fold hydrolase n=1 Tax=Chryseobacterium cheonjiense TaxID=2728845 RepID=A0A7Y0FK81_9FLAO|nr:alpha/beta fold hydrolase [Chryseobacterium cheonjiense]NML58887.1 alpha/beta fold hydrolase [Chryseobacterium cheonjiense]
MKKRSFFLICLLLHIVLYAQITIQGKVKNMENEILPYCNIGIKDTNIGSFTNKSGDYKMIIPKEFQNKSIVFKAEGYAENTKPISELLQNADVYLDFKIRNIQEVVLEGEKLKEKTIGQKSRPILTFSKMFDKNTLTVEQGNIFDIYKKTKLKSFSFHIMPSSRFESITLKLNIYDVKNGLPNQSLLNENIIFKTSTTGWQNIELSNYKLVFNNLDKIAITLQLLEYEPLKDSDFVFGISAKKSLSKNLLFRHQSQSQWDISDGTFLSNINVGYNNKGIDTVEKSDNNNDSKLTDEEKNLVTFYEAREDAKKTIYGKNPEGKFIKLTDANIYYEEYGTGEPLILLEGNNGIISDFYHQISFFSKYFHVITIDTRNQGKSQDFSNVDYGYEKLADDLSDIVDQLKLQKINILGWSDGGITGLLFSIKNPKIINKLVVIGANTNPKGVDDKFINSIKKRYENSDDLLEKRRLNLMINHPDIQSNDLKKIENPVLVIAGSNDLVKIEDTNLIHKNIPNSVLLVVPDTTHNAPLEKPDFVNQQILNFIKK